MTVPLKTVIAIGVGGFVGANLRYFVSGWTQDVWRVGVFPIGTATVNVIGCFVIGALGGLSRHVRPFEPSIYLFLLVGLLGSFTTFSTFSYDTLSLVQERYYLHAGLNVVGQTLGGLLFAFAGYSISLRCVG